MSDRESVDPVELPFAAFVLHYAKNFVGLYDEDGPLPEVFEHSPYYDQLARAAARRLAEAQVWDDARAEQEAKTAYEKALRARKDRAAAEFADRQAVQVRLAEVQRWDLPTFSDYQKKFKQNLINILEARIAAAPSYVPPLPAPETGAEFKARLIREAQADFDRHNGAYQQEVERVRKLNEWVQVLRENLAQSAAG